MKKSFIKAAVVIVSILAFVLGISIYDSEKLAEPIIGYSEAVTQIPLNSMWDETEKQQNTTSAAVMTDNTTASYKSETIALTEESTSDTTTVFSEKIISSETNNITELININTASVEELKQLKGIGDVIAARIVEYAQTVGFKTIDDIKNVKGIGDKKYEAIKDKITV